MSMSRGCIFVEVEANEWFGIVANNEHDYGITDGHTVYGPHSNEDEAIEQLMDNESNPGSLSVIPKTRIKTKKATKEYWKLINTGIKG